MISPTTVVASPLTGLPPVTADLIVSVLQGASVATFLPTSSFGLSKLLSKGFEKSGNRIPGPLAAAAASPAIRNRGTAIVAVLRTICRNDVRAIVRLLLWRDCRAGTSGGSMTIQSGVRTTMLVLPGDDCNRRSRVPSGAIATGAVADSTGATFHNDLTRARA